MKLRRSKKRPHPEGKRGPIIWLAPIVRHPWRTVILLCGAASLYGLLHWRILSEQEPWEIGDRVLRDVIAPADTPYPDTQETARRKQEARDGVKDVYDPRISAAAEETRRDITTVFSQANTARRDETDRLARFQKLNQALTIRLSSETLTTLVTISDPELGLLEAIARELAEAPMESPIRTVEELDLARKAIDAAAPDRTEALNLVSAAAEIATMTIHENQIHNAEATLAKQDEAAAQVETVRQKIRRNEHILRAGDTVEQVHIDMLSATGMMAYQKTDAYTRFLASAAAVATLLLIFVYYLHRFRPRFVRSSRCLGLIVGSFVVAAAIARLGAERPESEAVVLAAVAALAIVLTALLDTEVALVASIFAAFFADMAVPGSDPRLLMAAATAGIVAAFASGATGSRTSLIARTAVVCSVANCFLATAVNTVFGLPIELGQLGYAAAGGVGAALCAASAILVLERPLKIITEVRLLELSNPTEAVLKRLALEAPGSYASSVAVGNLAVAAADAVGADSLLVRVGSYYHDIGKLKRPYYFIENQQGGANPHDRLTAHLSAKVIISHVRDGLEFAADVGLPAEVQAFIAQHHGTTLVAYFYQRALQEAEEGEEVDEAAFRYEGPKPQTRETAIFMIADTVEAASRTLADPDVDSVRTMVHNLIKHKIDDGQFNECSLTFADITAIEDTLVRALCATHHQRIRYPAQLENGEAGEGTENGSTNGN